MKIKIGDNVLVIAGKDKGRTGEVLRLFHDKNKVVVAGLNMAKKTVKKVVKGAGKMIKKTVKKTK